MMRKKLYVVVGSGVAVLLVICLALFKHGGIPIQIVTTSKAVARVTLTFKNLINPNTNAKTELTIDGRTYCNLRGEPPFYVESPGGGYILFVTQCTEYPYRATLHVYAIHCKNDYEIDISDTAFGWNIGTKRRPGECATDYVESVSGSKLVITTRSFEWKNTIVVNFAARIIEHQETFYYDKNGDITNSIVHYP